MNWARIYLNGRCWSCTSQDFSLSERPWCMYLSGREGWGYLCTVVPSIGWLSSWTDIFWRILVLRRRSRLWWRRLPLVFWQKREAASSGTTYNALFRFRPVFIRASLTNPFFGSLVATSQRRRWTRWRSWCCRRAGSHCSRDYWRTCYPIMTL